MPNERSLALLLPSLDFLRFARLFGPSNVFGGASDLWGASGFVGASGFGGAGGFGGSALLSGGRYFGPSGYRMLSAESAAFIYMAAPPRAAAVNVGPPMTEAMAPPASAPSPPMT